MTDAAIEAQDGMVGWFFHRRDEANGPISWQGRIVSEPIPGVYMVELADWVVGSINERHMIPVEDMRHWTFYADEYLMNSAYEKYEESKPRLSDWRILRKLNGETE